MGILFVAVAVEEHAAAAVWQQLERTRIGNRELGKERI